VTINKTKTVGEFAVELPGATRIFEKLGIDYCCGGTKSLHEACSSAGVTEESVIALLKSAEKLGAEGDETRQWRTSPLSELTNYIVNKHHTFVRAELLRLKELLAKVCSMHSTHHPELFQIRDIFFRLQADLTDHMLKEEKILFPYIEKLEKDVGRGEASTKPSFGTMRNPVRMMMQEHDEADQALRMLRRVSSNYRAPTDGCNSFRMLYQALEEFERDLHQHIHLENNILFPRAADLEAASSYEFKPAS
jgi:regulator of cell morphogenesis and NO signaling